MLDAGQMDGRFFGRLILGNTIDNGGQTRADDKGPFPRANELRVGVMRFVIRSVHEHLIIWVIRQERQICVRFRLILGAFLQISACKLIR